MISSVTAVILLFCLLSGLAYSTDTGNVSDTSTNSTGYDSGLPLCRRCYFNTSGVCQQNNDVCVESVYYNNSDTEGWGCPVDSYNCQCPECADNTTGPCHLDDGKSEVICQLAF